MKVGTFVGREIIPLSSEEVKAVKDRIVTYARVLFEDTPFDFKDVKMNYDERFCINLNIKAKGKHTYLDPHRKKFMPTYITISFHKSKGYDEKVYGRFYEWKDGFIAPNHMESYSANIDLIGYERRYKCKTILHTSLIQIDYQFGTELIDIHFEECLHNIYQYLVLSNEINEKLPIKC